MRRLHSAVRLGMLLLALCFAASSELLAADQVIFGKKLFIRNPPSGAASNKVVHLGKDASITIGAAGSAGDPQCSGAGGGGTSSLRVAASGGAGTVTIPLPCTGWTTNGSNTLYKYRDNSGAMCSFVAVKNGVLTKAVCKGSQVAIDLNGGMSPVSVVTTLNTEQYCTEFGGTIVKDGGDDQTFLRKNAPAVVSCPTISSTTSTSVTTTSILTGPVCCNFMIGCNGGFLADTCDAADGVPGAAGTVCVGSGGCVAPPGTPGDCCQFPGSCYPWSSSACAEGGGTYHASAVCLGSGLCSP